MPRYKLTLEYDGRPYIGWQKQPGQRSVQGDLEKAAQLFSGEAVQSVAAGRTDAGVHATAQVAHIDFSKDHDPFTVMQGINYYLFNPADHSIIENPVDTAPNRIAVVACEKTGDDFHARFSATRRYYLYRIINRRARLALEDGKAWHVIEPLDMEAMRATARHLIGDHDFSSFRDTQCQAKSPIKTLDALQIGRQGDLVCITCHARSFLHHQVRIMVGSLALVGKGRWTEEDLRRARDARNRSAAGPTAPPDGLYLVGVSYS